jgi:hypothetical protein
MRFWVTNLSPKLISLRRQGFLVEGELSIDALCERWQRDLTRVTKREPISQ